MKITKLLCLVVLSLGFSVYGFSQKPYDNGIGIRIAPANPYYDAVAATYKFFISDAGAFDLNVGVGAKRYGGYYNGAVYYDNSKPFNLSVSAAYQHHFNINVRGGGFAWFVGGGLTGFRSFSSDGKYDGFGFGIFPTGGVDYKIPKIPLAVSADFRPTFFVASPDRLPENHLSNFGFIARYTFGKK